MRGRAGARAFDWERETPIFQNFGCGAFDAAKIPLFGPFFANVQGAKLVYAPLERDWRRLPLSALRLWGRAYSVPSPKTNTYTRFLFRELYIILILTNCLQISENLSLIFQIFSFWSAKNQKFRNLLELPILEEKFFKRGESNPKVFRWCWKMPQTLVLNIWRLQSPSSVTLGL